MSKNLLILLLFIFQVFKLNAQCSPDNSITKPGFYPSTLPQANVGDAYNQIIQFKFIKDTTVIVFGNPTPATIDSMTIVSVTGMPDGLTFKLNKTKPTYTPAEVGCALVSGIPTKGGTFKLKIALIIYAKVSSFPVAQKDTVKNFSITVTGAGSVSGFYEHSNQLYPNPVKSNQVFINRNLTTTQTKINIFNYLGEYIESPKIENDNSIIFNNPPGLYYFEIVSNNKISRVKLLKE